jgi:glyoxylase I family protein
MPIKLETVGIAVSDIDAAIAFFTDLGLTVLGRDTVSGEWADTAVGLDGNHAHIAMLQTPDGRGRLELFEYIHPDAVETEPTQPNEIGMHRVAFSVDDIDEALEVAASTTVTHCGELRRTRRCTSSPMSEDQAASSSCSRRSCRGAELPGFPPRVTRRATEAEVGEGSR